MEFEVKRMLIVGINGSPHKNGNTRVLLDKVLASAQAQGAVTELLHAAELVNSAKHPFCIVCSNPCNGSCFEGTKMEEAFDLLAKADGVVIGSPVYFGTVSGQLKALFDKTRKLRKEQGLYNTVGAGVTVATTKYGGQETTMRAIHDIMLVHGMVIVGDGYVENDMGHLGASAHRPAANDDYALARAKIIGKRLVEVANLLKKP